MAATIRSNLMEGIRSIKTSLRLYSIPQLEQFVIKSEKKLPQRADMDQAVYDVRHDRYNIMRIYEGKLIEILFDLGKPAAFVEAYQGNVCEKMKAMLATVIPPNSSEKNRQNSEYAKSWLVEDEERIQNLVNDSFATELDYISSECEKWRTALEAECERYESIATAAYLVRDRFAERDRNAFKNLPFKCDGSSQMKRMQCKDFFANRPLDVEAVDQFLQSCDTYIEQPHADDEMESTEEESAEPPRKKKKIR